MSPILRRLRVGQRPLIMGILNVTPDSFSDGGRHAAFSDAVRHGRALAAAGADIIDVGGESTRPGAAHVDEATELERVVPVISALVADVDVPISVDTSRPAVMAAAVRAGATMVNDVRALRRPGAEAMVRDLGVPVCLMHMRGEPADMQTLAHYDDVVTEVRDYLLERAGGCEAAGISRDHILVDPGFGFAKTADHNLALLADLDVLVRTGYPVVAGLSRKSSIPRWLGRDMSSEERVGPSTVLAVLAAAGGAAVVRVHDVRETADALRLWALVESGRRAGGASGSATARM